jgi:hypothetical protein
LVLLSVPTLYYIVFVKTKSMSFKSPTQPT